MAKKFLSLLETVNLPSDPVGTNAGQLYYNTNIKSLKYFDGTTWISFGDSTGNLPAGGSTGQILAKINNSDYNTEWIDNYANWTSTVKHRVLAGESIAKGQAVYTSSSDGTNVIVSLASNASEATSSKTLGIAAQSMAAASQGYVITEGLLSGLDTSTASIGDPVWLGISGNLIYGLTNKPVAPAHLVYLGVVTRSHAVNGEIFVKIQNGYELEELHNVLITSVADNNILSYDNATSLWKNQALVDAIKEIDGTGSGIDSDLLDGENGSYYLDWTNTTNKPDPTITLGGDLSGSLTLTDLAGGTLTATIVANSVELGTDTTGNYVATIAGTTDQISVTGSGSESAAITLSTPQNIATTSSPTFAGATLDAVQIGITTAGEIDTTSGNLTLDSAGGTVLIDDNLSVTGNLTVNGTTTTVNSTTVTVDDPIITLGGDTAPTSDDNKDRGVEFRYYDTQARLGFMGYDDSAGQFVFLTAATNTSEVFSGTKGTIDANISGSNINAGTVSATYIDSAIARLASPTFTGIPAAPTAIPGTNTTQIATTAFVISSIVNIDCGEPTSTYEYTIDGGLQ